MNPFFDSSVTDACPPSMYLDRSSVDLLFDDPSVLDRPPASASEDVSVSQVSHLLGEGEEGGNP